MITAATVVFEECIQFYEDPKFTALFRPVLDSGLNRLQYVLFDPTFTGPIDAEDPEGSRKRWMEAGARVARYVLARLNELDPAITRPTARRGRGLQEDLFALYTTIETVMHTPEFKAILFPSELPTEEGPTPPTASVHE
ncbi:hypothetical protein [Nocardia salmonicida]|uniref:hypothetical protein n=1 Tax=Nocardia salmonicida TaxID=53431 RepID=UPI003401B943